MLPRLFIFSLLIASSTATFADMVTVPTLTPGTTPTVTQTSTSGVIPSQGTYTLFGIASPAAMKCFEDGGKLRGTKGVSGPVAYCVFNKPFQIIEEWAYFRGEIARAQ